MAFYTINYNPNSKVYFPRAVVKGKPVETEEIAAELSEMCTVTEGDVLAVLGNLPGVMHKFMKLGKSVHLEKLGFFKLELSSKGVASLAEFDFDAQKETVHVRFNPERVKAANGSFSRKLVDYSTIEWVNLSEAAAADDGSEASESADSEASESSSEASESGSAESAA